MLLTFVVNPRALGTAGHTTGHSRATAHCSVSTCPQFSARYSGNKCTDYNLRSMYSPDGRFVVSGSEDGSLFTWLEETGELVLEGLPVGLRGAPRAALLYCPHLLARRSSRSCHSHPPNEGFYQSTEPCDQATDCP